MIDQVQKQARGRALVSDDDDFFRVAIKSVLCERNGFSEVIETSSFDAALDRLGSLEKFDVGLFDLNMVGMENWLDLSAIRKEYPDMLLIVVSGSRLRTDILAALEIGAHGFVHKGLGVCELSRAVDLICDGQVYVPPFMPENPAGTVPVRNGKATTQTSQHAPEAPCDDTHLPDSALPEPESEQARELNCSPRQKEIIDLLIAGQSNKGMARALNLSEGTIKFHMSAVMRLLGAKSRVEAATRAMKILEP